MGRREKSHKIETDTKGWPCQSGKKKLSETQEVLKYIERDCVSQLIKTNFKICALLGNRLPRG